MGKTNPAGGGSGRLWKILCAAAAAIALALLVLNALGVRLFTTRTGMTVIGNNESFRLRDIGELATQEAVLTRLQTVSDSRQILGVTMPFTQKRYIYSYDVIIRAGVDFSRVEVTPEAGKVRIAMPPARILDARVDTDSLQVYEEKQNAFNALHIENFNDSIGVMLQEGRKYAVERGVLDHARGNAELLIRGLLSASYPEREYTYEFVWADGGEAIE